MKNSMEKYFTQKQWTVLEIICLVLAVVAGVAAVFVWGGGPIGTPICIVSVIALVVSKSQKIKDSEVESVVKKAVEPCLKKINPKAVVRGYDLSAAPLVKGKDGIWRSPSYIFAHFDFRENSTHIFAWRLNLLNGETAQDAFVLPKASGVRLTEVALPIAGKMACVLECDVPTMHLPISMNDAYAAELVERIRELHK